MYHSLRMACTLEIGLEVQEQRSLPRRPDVKERIFRQDAATDISRVLYREEVTCSGTVAVIKVDGQSGEWCRFFTLSKVISGCRCQRLASWQCSNKLRKDALLILQESHIFQSKSSLDK
jgi:hypothetical protein